MERRASVAERLDRAVEQLIRGMQPSFAAADGGVDPDGMRMLRTAELLRDALVPPPVAPRFEARLGARLAGVAAHDPVAWALRHPGRLIVTGAVGSAVGVGVTAYAVWRSTRRPTATRLWHR